MCVTIGRSPRENQTNSLSCSQISAPAAAAALDRELCSKHSRSLSGVRQSAAHPRCAAKHALTVAGRSAACMKLAPETALSTLPQNRNAPVSGKTQSPSIRITGDVQRCSMPCENSLGQLRLVPNAPTIRLAQWASIRAKTIRLFIRPDLSQRFQWGPSEEARQANR